MATLEQYAQWLVDNKAQKGSEDWQVVVAAFKKLDTPAPIVEPEGTSLLGYGLETGKALLGGAAGLVQSAATGASFILPEEAEQAARARIGEIGGDVQDFFATDEAYEGTYTDLMKGVGSTLPFLAAAPFGAVGLAAGAFTGITAGAGEAAQRAVAAGATEEEISKAAGLGTIPGALEMFGPARIVNRFRKVLGNNADDVAEELSGSIIKKISQATERAPLGRVGKAAIDEGIQEAISEVGQNLIQRGVYDPERGVFTGTGESFGMGAGVGGLLQGIAEAIIPGQKRRATRKAEAATQKEAEEAQAATIEAEAAASEEAMAPVLVDETRDMFPEELAVAEQGFQGPEPEQLMEVEDLAGVTEEAPIAVSPTPETDLIADLEETDQVQALVDEDEYAAIQAEEDAAKANLDAAVTQKLSAIEIAKRENELSNVQQRIETQQAEETQTKRGPILAAVLEADTTSQVNTERAFSKALAEAGISNTTPTDAERQAITQKTYEIAQQRPELALVEPEVLEPEIADGKSVAELEAVVPEAGDRQARREAVQAEKERKANEVLITPTFFDGLNIRPSAPIRKQKLLQGKDIKSPEVRAALEKLATNKQITKTTRDSINNYLESGIAPVVETTTPVEGATAPETTAPRTFASTPQPIAATVAMPDTDKQKLDKRKNEPLPTRDIYEPKPAMSYYMQNATDSDQALRIIAFEGLVDPTLETTSPKDVSVREKKRADAAAQWVKSNLSPTSKAKLNEYTKFYKSELAQLTAKGEVFLERMNAQQALAREGDTTSAEYEAAEIKRNEDLLKDQINEAYNNKKAEAAALTNEFLTDTDASALTEKIINSEYSADRDYLRSDAVAATMPTVSESVNDKVLDGDLKGALEQLTVDSSNPEVKRSAEYLSKAIKDTRIEFVEELTNQRGDVSFAGNYTASQDLIQISLSSPLSIHTILHEATHAVTSKILDIKSHPTTIQLTKLFNEVKDKLPEGSYGKESLKDFVAEAYSNASFRTILAAQTSAGSKLTTWQRFTNAVKSLFGMPTTPVQNMEVEVVDYIDTILAETIATRNATTVTGSIAEGEAIRAVYEMMGGGTALAKVKDLKDSRNKLWENAKEFTAKSRMTLINSMTLDNLVDYLDGKLPSAVAFQELIRKQDGLRDNMRKEFGNKLKDFRDAFKSDSKAIQTFNTLVGLSTVEEVDPTKPPARYGNFGYSYTNTDGTSTEKVTFATAAKRDAAVEALDRTLIAGGVKKLNTTPERVAAHREAQKLYNSLTRGQKEVYIKMRDAYKDMNAKIIQAIDEKLSKLELDKNVKAVVKEEVFRKMLTSGVIDPYFPLDRSGNFWVEYDYKDADGQVQYGVSAHKTAGARKVAMARLKERTDVVRESIKVKPRPDLMAKDSVVPTTFLVQLLDELKKPVTITDKDGTERKVKVPQEALDFVSDVLVKSLPEQNLLQGHMERQGIAGYETDAMKTFEETFPAMINSFANLTFDVDFTKVAKKMKEESKSGENAGNRLVEDIRIAMVGSKAETDGQAGKLSSYLEFVRNPNLPNWARILRSSSFIYTLGFNVSSAAVNMSTLPMIVGPLLSGKFGGAKATSAMSRAMNMYMQSFGEVTREGITKEGTTGDIQELGGFSYTNKAGGPLGPLKARLVATGLDTRTISSENADYENPAAPLLNKIAYVSSFIFNHSERAIRQVTAASSYILEVEKAYAEANKGKPAKKIDKMSEAEITQFGEAAAIVATDFMEYANSSALLATAPRWAQTGPGAIIYQFKRFPAQILYVQMSMLNAIQRQARGVKRTPEQIEDDRALRNAFIYMTATGGALVGVKGIPFYGLVAMIADMFLGEDEDDTNTIVAKTISDKYYYGAVAKYFGTDVTDRVALTNLMIRDKGNYRPQNDTEHLLESYGGPSIGISLRLWETFGRLTDDNPQNDQRAWEAALPTAFANMKKALRYSVDGYETTRGVPIIGDVTIGDAIRQAVGFAPSKFRAAQDKLARDRRVTNGIKDMRTGLLDRFAFAHNNGDEAGKQEVVKEIQEFNKKHGNVAILGSNLVQSIKTRARGSAIGERLGGNVAERRFIRSIQESRLQYGEEL